MNTKQIEYRTFKVELRADEGQPRKIVGYAAVFNETSLPLFDRGIEFTETIRPGAFTDALADPDLNVICNVDHTDTRMLGRTKSGTLRLTQDDHGLLIECDLPDTTEARDISELMRRGDYKEMSFAFQAIEEEWSPDRSEREIISCTLHDVAVVIDGAYSQTEVALRAKQKAISRHAWRRRLLSIWEKENK